MMIAPDRLYASCDYVFFNKPDGVSVCAKEQIKHTSKKI